MSEGYVKDRQIKSTGKREWDAYLASGEMVGYGLKTKRGAEGLLKRAAALRKSPRWTSKVR